MTRFVIGKLIQLRLTFIFITIPTEIKTGMIIAKIKDNSILLKPMKTGGKDNEIKKICKFNLDSSKQAMYIVLEKRNTKLLRCAENDSLICLNLSKIIIISKGGTVNGDRIIETYS